MTSRPLPSEPGANPYEIAGDPQQSDKKTTLGPGCSDRFVPKKRYVRFDLVRGCNR